MLAPRFELRQPSSLEQVLGLVERRVDGVDSVRSGIAVNLGGATSAVEPVQR